MTNEENINNIVSEVVIFGNEVSVDALKYALSLLARRKDQQFKEYLEKKRNNANMAYIISNDANEDYLNGKADAIQEIINERFKEDKK